MSFVNEIIRTTILLFYDKFLRYVTKFAAMTSGQRSKSAVHPELRYGYVPCPLYDTGKWFPFGFPSFSFSVFSFSCFACAFTGRTHVIDR